MASVKAENSASRFHGRGDVMAALGVRSSSMRERVVVLSIKALVDSFLYSGGAGGLGFKLAS